MWKSKTIYKYEEDPDMASSIAKFLNEEDISEYKMVCYNTNVIIILYKETNYI